MAKLFTTAETIGVVVSVIFCMLIVYGPRDTALHDTVRSVASPIGTWMLQVLSKVIYYESMTCTSHWASPTNPSDVRYSEPEACERIRTWKDLALICPEQQHITEEISTYLQYDIDCFPKHLWGLSDNTFPYKTIVKLGYRFETMYEEFSGRYKTIQSTCDIQEDSPQVVVVLHCEVVESSIEDNWLDYWCDAGDETFIWRRYAACIPFQ